MIQSQAGETEVSVPSDRNGEFEPKMIPKQQRNVTKSRSKFWPCPRDIENHLKDIYGIDISTGNRRGQQDYRQDYSFSSGMTARQFEKVYPVVF